MLTFATCSCRYLSQCSHSLGARQERRSTRIRRSLLALATLGIIAGAIVATQYAAAML